MPGMSVGLKHHTKVGFKELVFTKAVNRILLYIGSIFSFLVLSSSWWKQENPFLSRKKRNSGTETLVYLKEKAERDFELNKEVLNVEKQKMEVQR